MFEEQGGDQCGWSRVSGRESGAGEGLEVTGQIMPGLRGHGEAFGFYPT